ncbi:MAG: ferrous iron transport protein B [Mangrovibacterium sp.]
MRLSEVKNNETVVIVKVLGHGSFRRRIIEMGFVRGKEVRVVKSALLNGPIEYKILDYNVTLRRSEASLIEVVSLDQAEAMTTDSFEGVFNKEVIINSAIEKAKVINIGLVGNPNCGKTTIFNQLSGLKEHVGNYSGVTVDAKKASFSKFGYRFNLVDLPGTYSLAAYSSEEIFVRNFIRDERPDIVVNVLDGSNLERNLYLTTQLIDMDIKVICALNMFDEMQANGIEFQHVKMGELLGIPFVPMVGSRAVGIDDLLLRAIEVYEDRDEVERHVHINYGEEIEKSIQRIRAEIKKGNIALVDTMSSRFLAIKLLEDDSLGVELVSKYANSDHIFELSGVERRRLQLLFNEDSETIITDAKYGFIAGALKQNFVRNGSDEESKSDRIDRWLTHPVLGIPIFIALMFFTFYATFTLGSYPMGWIEWAVGQLNDWVASVVPEGMLHDLLCNGIIDGVGSVLVFLPNILILFLFISIMEDSGYMARAAFIMDKVMHFFGLHGRSFIPMIMGFGCNVPAIMATRSLRNPGDRLLTMLIVPFMSCSARLPVYVLFVSAFFPSHAALVLGGIYLFGIIIAFVMAQIFNKTIFRNKETPFVMELPPYRMPTMRNAVVHMWDKSSQYLRKIGTVVLFGAVLVWALGYFPRTQEGVDETTRLEQSYLGRAGQLVEPVMRPLGFDWKMSVALVAGLPAKEIVVSTLGVLYQVEDADEGNASLQNRLRSEKYTSGDKVGETVISGAVALAFLIFVLIYFPCIGVIATIRSESGRTLWAVFTMLYTSGLAWVMAWVVKTVAEMF